MITKGARTSPSKDFVLAGPFTVALALYAMINVQSLQGGACYNPAVGLAQLVFDIAQTDGPLSDSEVHYMWIFLTVPLMGGVLSALAMMYYERVFAKFDDF